MRLPCVPPLIPMSVDLPSRSHLGLELEEAGCSAALQALSSLCSGLSSSRDQRRTAIDQLHEKHRRIAKFAQAAVSGKPCSQASLPMLTRPSILCTVKLNNGTRMRPVSDELEGRDGERLHSGSSAALVQYQNWCIFCD